MKKDLLNFFVLACVLTVMATSAAFADVSKASTVQQQQTELYNQQLDYLRQQTEYLRQQTDALRQNQAYNQGYIEGQRYSYHRNVYVPGVFFGGIAAGYLLGHRHGYGHCCHHCW